MERFLTLIHQISFLARKMSMNVCIVLSPYCRLHHRNCQLLQIQNPAQVLFWDLSFPEFDEITATMDTII